MGERAISLFETVSGHFSPSELVFSTALTAIYGRWVELLMEDRVLRYSYKAT